MNDSSLDSVLRPQKWNNYIGQENIKNHLSILIDAAKERKQMPEHILLHGSSGMGKTTLAHLIGVSIGVSVRTTTGPMLEKAGDIVAIMTSIKEGGVFFIDEIHRLNKNVEEVLYPIMETGSLSIMVGSGPSARPVEIKLPPITIVAATTMIGNVSSPLRSRFGGGVLKLENYNDNDVFQIVKQSANVLGIETSEEALYDIAARSRKTPRVANSILKRVRDMAQINKTAINKKMSEKTFDLLGIDSFGLRKEDLKVLTTIAENFNFGPVGINTLATSMNEDPRTIEEVYEPYLIQLGLLERTQKGRSITKKGKAFLRPKK